MKKKLEKIFLRSARNSMISGFVVIILFAGMFFSLWTLLDRNRILTQFDVIGKLVPYKTHSGKDSSFSQDKEVLAELIVLNDFVLQEKIKLNDEIRIMFSSEKDNNGIRATVLDFNKTKTLSEGNMNTLLLRVIFEKANNNSVKNINMLFSGDRYSKMMILVRSKKLWEAAIEKIAL